MADTEFIQVIVPLPLEWEPYYRLKGASVGDRVNVEFARRKYQAVVSAVNQVPQTPPERILEAQPSGLPPVSPEEIRFWRALSAYYLCPLGDVFKAAYPGEKNSGDQVKVRTRQRLQERLEALREKLDKARKDSTRERYLSEIDRVTAILEGKSGGNSVCVPPLSPALEQTSGDIRDAFCSGKTVLLNAASGPGKTELYLHLAARCLEKGRSVLLLVPEIGLFQEAEARVKQAFPGALMYHSARSAAQRREVADQLRTGTPQLVLGTRSALFLPFRSLGLIIVDQEHETSYKQDSPAPRYHARESAIMLALVHGANVLLGSETPSLESIYNAEHGIFTSVELKQDLNLENPPQVQLVNLAAERRKRGVVGSFSLKLLEKMHQTLSQGKQMLLVCRSQTHRADCQAETEAIFGPETKSIVLQTPSGAKQLPAASYPLVAVLQADSLLSREDFRCDERAHQLLSLLQDKCLPGGDFVIQTWEAGHPAFGPYSAARIRELLEERRQFGYPPYTRLIDVVLRDPSEKRVNYMAAELARVLSAMLPEGSVLGPLVPAQEPGGGTFLRQIRLMLPRDKALKMRKQALREAVPAFEKERKYLGHIVLDVDPV